MPNQQVIPEEIVTALVECFTKDNLIATAAAGVFTFRYGDDVVDVFTPTSLMRAAHEANPLVKERYAAELNGAFNMFRFFRDNPELLSSTLRARIIDIPKSKKNEVLSILSPLQRIYYGAPGTGKSHQTDKIVKEIPDTIRVTFHPDSDYASFVGCYKPTMRPKKRIALVGKKFEEGDVSSLDESLQKDDVIVYEFVPQAFARAYAQAWAKMAEAKDGKPPAPQFLVIEEINRGNCAQIFGDLFQLLDRDDNGYSKYPVDPDADLAKHLHDWFRGDYVNGDGTESPTIVGDSDGDKWKARKAGSGESDATWADVFSGRKLVLPPNLHIWATMNTSDQSLFPIDSAFKRRWDWEYVPIDNAKKGWAIVADGKRFDWWAFLEKANEAVRKATGSEDKELGYFFVKPPESSTDIPAKTFVDKVLFYLFGDAFKDDTSPLSLFPKKSDGAGAWTLRDFRENVLEGGSAKSKPNEKNLAAWLEQIKINPPGKPESASDGGDATAADEGAAAAVGTPAGETTPAADADGSGSEQT